jgi:phospholipid/cholesterol/gamma-HCH transport system ATP-binding protein
MVGLMRPDDGRVLVDGADLTHAAGEQLAALRRKFGVLFQSGALINWMTLAENVALPLVEHTDLSAEEIDQRVREKLEWVGLSDYRHLRPAEISGGMKKRAGLARAIIHEPEVILYDEPTSGLDPVLSRHIDQLIRNLQRRLGVTSVVVTHDLHSAFTVGDRIAMLYEGQVATVGTPAEFRECPHPFVQSFIKAQFVTGQE